MLAGEIIAKENALKSNQYLTENPFFFNEKVYDSEIEYKNLIILLLFKISKNSIIFYRLSSYTYAILCTFVHKKGLITQINIRLISYSYLAVMFIYTILEIITSTTGKNF